MGSGAATATFPQTAGARLPGQSRTLGAWAQPKAEREAGGLARPSDGERGGGGGPGPHRAGLGEPLWDLDRWPEVRGQGRDRWRPMGGARQPARPPAAGRTRGAEPQGGGRGRLDPTPAAPRVGEPRQLTTVVRTQRLRLFAGPSSPRRRARAGSGNWDLPHSHHEAAGEGARQGWGLVTAKAESERRARLRHRFPNLKRLLKASVKMRRCARGREAIHTTCPTRHTL